MTVKTVLNYAFYAAIAAVVGMWGYLILTNLDTTWRFLSGAFGLCLIVWVVIWLITIPLKIIAATISAGVEDGINKANNKE